MDTETTIPTTEQPQTETPPAEVDERQVLIDAIKAERGEEAGERKTPERGEDGKFKPREKAEGEPAEKPRAKAKPKEEEPPAPPPDEDEASLPSLARAIRAREKAQAQRDELADLRSQIERERQEAAAERAAAKAEREAAAKEAAEARANMERFARLRQSPREAARELGWDENGLQEFAGAALNENKPEAIALRKLMERDAAREKEIAELRTWREQQEKTAAERQREYEARQQQEAGDRAIQELLSLPSVEKTPNLIRFYRGREALFVAEAQRIAHDYKVRTNGQVAPLAEIVEYMEYEEAQRASPPPQPASGANGVAAKAKANGQRSLSAAAASERRSAPKPIEDMTADEEREFLITQIREAR